MMQTFLILSSHKSYIENYIKKLIADFKISTFDILDFNPEEKIGVADIKSIIRQSITSPFSGNHKLTLVRNIGNSTFEAQNSLLKFLEEQPLFLTILLTAQNSQNILPTVLSRAQIIQDTQKRDKKILELNPLLEKSIGERLFFLQTNIKSKEDASKFLESLIETLEKHLLSQVSIKKNQISPKEIAGLINKTEKARVFLESNLNYKHVLDVLLLGFPRIKD